MFYRSRRLSILVICAIIFQGSLLMIARAQTDDNVRNTRFSISEKIATITYDLQGDPEREYTIVVFLHRKSDSTLHYMPQAVTGDIGAGCRTGNNKQIIWNMAKEYRLGLEGDDFFFTVIAEPAPAKGSSWLYIAGGAVVVGVVVVYLLTQSSGETSSADQGFPRPVGRPVH
jgi:hypothetical protein